MRGAVSVRLLDHRKRPAAELGQRHPPDPRRLLWLATFGGLVRFDGVRFVVYDRGTEGIGSQRTRILHEDAQGTLWAATDDGMLIRYRDGRFTTYGAGDGLPYNVALRLDDDDQGNLWITWNGVVTRFDGKRFTNYRQGEFAPAVMPHDFTVREGDVRSYPQKFWWGQDSLGVHVLVNGRVQTHRYDSVLPRDTDVAGVNADRDGNVWVHTRGAAVVKISMAEADERTPSATACLRKASRS